MKLYLVYGSPNCRKVQATVHALGIDIDLQPLDFFAGDLHKPEYLAINPNAMVPSLVDGDLKLWESNAIMHYLAAKKPGNKLLPDNPRMRADILRWQCWELAHFNRACGTLVLENFLKPRFMSAQPDPRNVEDATSAFHRFAPVLDKHLADTRFIVGPEPTLADFSVGAGLGFAKAAAIPLDKYPKIRAWYQRLEAVPAWADSAPPSQMVA